VLGSDTRHGTGVALVISEGTELGAMLGGTTLGVELGTIEGTELEARLGAVEGTGLGVKLANMDGAEL